MSARSSAGRRRRRQPNGAADPGTVPRSPLELPGRNTRHPNLLWYPIPIRFLYSSRCRTPEAIPPRRTQLNPGKKPRAEPAGRSGILFGCFSEIGRPGSPESRGSVARGRAVRCRTHRPSLGTRPSIRAWGQDRQPSLQPNKSLRADSELSSTSARRRGCPTPPFQASLGP